MNKAGDSLNSVSCWFGNIFPSTKANRQSRVTLTALRQLLEEWDFQQSTYTVRTSDVGLSARVIIEPLNKIQKRTFSRRELLEHIIQDMQMFAARPEPDWYKKVESYANIASVQTFLDLQQATTTFREVIQLALTLGKEIEKERLINQREMQIREFEDQLNTSLADAAILMVPFNLAMANKVLQIAFHYKHLFKARYISRFAEAVLKVDLDCALSILDRLRKDEEADYVLTQIVQAKAKVNIQEACKIAERIVSNTSKRTARCEILKAQALTNLDEARKKALQMSPAEKQEALKIIAVEEAKQHRHYEDVLKTIKEIKGKGMCITQVSALCQVARVYAPTHQGLANKLLRTALFLVENETNSIIRIEEYCEMIQIFYDTDPDFCHEIFSRALQDFEDYEQQFGNIAGERLVEAQALFNPGEAFHTARELIKDKAQKNWKVHYSECIAGIVTQIAKKDSKQAFNMSKEIPLLEIKMKALYALAESLSKVQTEESDHILQEIYQQLVNMQLTPWDKVKRIAQFARIIAVGLPSNPRK